MNTRSELFIYTILIAAAALLSFLLVRNAITARAERAELSQGTLIEVDTEKNKLPEPTPLEEAIAVFKESKLFADLNELLPTPTKVILPTPTPTVAPLCEGWEIAFLSAGKLAQIRDAGGKMAPYKVGETVPKDASLKPDYKLLKIEKDRVAILRLSDREWCWLYKGGGAERMEGPPPE
jgi:hypothetical protein